MDATNQVDELCDRFETQWRAGPRPRIEDYLAQAPAGLRASLLRGLLPVEMELLRREGKSPDQKSYLNRFPAESEAIASIFASPNAGGSETSMSNAGVRTASYRGRPADEPIPATIGRFTILSVLGQGAFGRVYRARDPQLDRDVALKIPRTGAFESADDRERFLREAKAAAAIQHPNICPVHDVVIEGDSVCIVMAYVPGKPLSDLLAQRKSLLPTRQAIVMVRKLAQALQAAHSRGIVHRDLKPGNILFDSERKDVLITDFGLARRVMAGDAELTRHGDVMGSPAYMSPEQARGDSKNVGPATDIYSLGVILYELLTGTRPFKGTLGEIIGQVQHVAPDPPSRRMPGLDPRLEAICLRAMSKSPADRFGTMREFVGQLSELLKDSPSAAIKPGTPPDTRPAPDHTASETIQRAADSTKIDHTRRSLARLIVAVGAGLGVLLIVVIALLGGLFTREDGRSVVTVTLQNIQHLYDNSVHYYLDGAKIDSKKLAGPLKLGEGEHRLEGKRGNEVIEERRFVVRADDDQKKIVAPLAEADGPAGVIREWKQEPNVTGLAISPDGQWLLTAGASFSPFNHRGMGMIRLWNLNTGEKIHEEQILNAEIVRFAPHGNLAYVGIRSVDPGPASVTMFDLTKPTRWKDVRTFDCSRGYQVFSLETSRDGDRLIMGTRHDGSYGPAVNIWDTQDGKRLASLDGPAHGCFFPDGKRFFAGQGNDLVSYEIREGKPVPIETYKGHTAPVRSVACSRDGTLVAAGTLDPANAVRVWEVATAKPLETFTRHKSTVMMVRFSPDGRQLLSAGADGFVRVSDVKTGDVIHETPAQGSAIVEADFTPGGRRIVFGLADGTVKIWQLPK